MERTALVVGVTGIAGYNIASALLAEGWRVVGLSRSPRYEVPGVEHVYADVLDRGSVEAATAGKGITHLFFATWSRQDTEAQNCAVNGAMLANTLDALAVTADLQHSVLVTGLKHYLGPFEAYASAPADTPFRETQERLAFQNFYYEQEDILFRAAAQQGFTWSVHRPHTMIGYALGNAMNMGVTLAVYGSICRATGEAFVFPGSPQQFNGVTDITDARLLGRHAVWSATAPAARNQAFNTTNGDVFRWRQMWPQVAAGLGVDAAPYPGRSTPLDGRMDHADDVWKRLVAEHDLTDLRAGELASWWHTDADLGREVETFADMSKSRALGFLDYQDSVRSFLDLFETLRAQRVIPPLGS
ncbi:MAG TPA: SDR family oxidoreductase [Jatrophihabitans sp.]|jgi:nucleoside-diphosphate-sugar epimerase|uniref:SDR family oxidoreductase n=1 Tax=Jatrophihabitans sp. TaxID=1932789 RepID=UPI002E01366A|nr:SDR family oxidoreductase [Jatrophihabitans sp.]